MLGTLAHALLRAGANFSSRFRLNRRCSLLATVNIGLHARHGHVDHFGGAPYLQEHYGTHIYLSQTDWNLISAFRRLG